MTEKEKLLKERDRLMKRFAKLLYEIESGKYDKNIRKALKR